MIVNMTKSVKFYRIEAVEQDRYTTHLLHFIKHRFVMQPLHNPMLSSSNLENLPYFSVSWNLVPLIPFATVQ
jgi:hypothetical protein